MKVTRVRVMRVVRVAKRTRVEQRVRAAKRVVRVRRRKTATAVTAAKVYKTNKKKTNAVENDLLEQHQVQMHFDSNEMKMIQSIGQTLLIFLLTMIFKKKYKNSTGTGLTIALKKLKL